MKTINRIRQEFVGRVTFPFTNFLYNRRGILSHYHDMLKSEWYPEDRLKEIQLAKLKKVIRHAFNHVSFYRKRFNDIGLEPGDIKQIEDIEAIPLLTRQDVIDCHKDMVADNYKSSISSAEKTTKDPGTPIPFSVFRSDKLIRNTSSGSTGAPTVFYEDGTRTAINWAHELRLKNWFGLSPGAREGRVTRLSTDYMPKSRLVRFRRLLWNQLLLPGVNLDDEDYRLCVDQLLEFQPEAIWGFTSASAGLAEFIVRQGGLPGGYRPKVVVGWAAPVYEHEEKVMREAYQCEVTNIYGAREVGHIAGKCPAGSFHINAENMIVEQVSLEKDTENDAGELVVTNTDVLAMPFIRYRMGDIGRLAKSNCTCGRNLPVIEDLLGRTGEVFYTKSGRMISPNFWCRAFMNKTVSGAVKRFQVIYTKDRDLRIKLVQDEGYSAEFENYLRNLIETNFSTNTNLELNYVDKIEPEISGKYLMVVNENA